MEDAVRPNKQAFKAMYERGCRTWFRLYEMAVADIQSHTPWWSCLNQLETAFTNHPSFPPDLAVDASFSNTALVMGTSTWSTTEGSCDLPAFEQEFVIPVASDRPVVLDIEDVRPRWLGEDDDHITVLVLAWTYILSARWAEIIPRAIGPEYNNNEAEWDDCNFSFEKDSTGKRIIDLGDVDDDAARWWAAVLAQKGGWNATLLRDKGHILHLPWYTKLMPDQRFTLSRGTKSHYPSAQCPAASFATVLRYLTSYCEYHRVYEQSHAALAAALLLPVARYDNRSVQLPTPRIRRIAGVEKETIFKPPPWTENLNQLDRLLTLSCNALGTKDLLNSVFFEPGVECHICGAWLQGTFAFLDSDIMKDQQLLLRVLMKRDPCLGFLWPGAFILGAQVRSFQEARQAWWKIDLNAAAWTGTLMSFIQEPVSVSAEREEISRADEARLLYLSHGQPYSVPPLFPFAPFGSTALTDTNIDVRQHAQCKAIHSLKHESIKWRCRGGKHTTATLPHVPYHAKNGHPTNKNNIPVNYDNLDQEEEDENSEMVTRNIFTWLRDEDGFPVAERGIREHEWIDNLDDGDDDGPVTGDVRSTAGGNLHGWLMKTMTTRCNSL